ncbi:integration host factor subunit alpha [bacterium]|nr:integration host factor subunit alpha [bacterium]
MTKEDLIKNVWEELDITNKEARQIVENVFDTMKNVLAKGEQIEIRGFGKFSVRDKNKRTGRNPRTGEEAEISARKVVTFKPSKIFKNMLK